MDISGQDTAWVAAQEDFDADPCGMIALEAVAKGYTRNVLCDSDECTLEGWVKPDADLDGRFTLIEGGTGERLRVNGWLFTTEDA